MLEVVEKAEPWVGYQGARHTEGIQHGFFKKEESVA